MRVFARMTDAGGSGTVPIVTPAQAGVQAAFFWIPAFAGMTGQGQGCSLASNGYHAAR